MYCETDSMKKLIDQVDRYKSTDSSIFTLSSIVVMPLLKNNILFMGGFIDSGLAACSKVLQVSHRSVTITTICLKS